MEGVTGIPKSQLRGTSRAREIIQDRKFRPQVPHWGQRLCTHTDSIFKLKIKKTKHL